MIDAIKKEKCTGCKMCSDICNQKAISFVADKEGFWYPIVDKEKCNHCGLCVKTCPSLKTCENRNSQPKVFSAWSNSDKVRYKSTSGGVFFELADIVIKKGGYIAGCSYSKDYYSAEHIIGNDEKALEKIIGSKYFQSDTQGIYKAVKDLLDNDKTVLFAGTPCQNAALKNFLSKEYNNLYQCDFICRGINSPLAYQKFIEELEENYGTKISKVRFKSKRTQWNSLATEIDFKNGKKYFKDRYSDPWINGYISGDLYMRPVCFECLYKTLPRVSDISLGDFWGIKYATKEDLKQGISVVLVNSKKGESLLFEVEKELNLQQHSIDEAVAGNPCILKSAVIGKKRELFFNMLGTKPFSKIVWELTGMSHLKRFKRKIKTKYYQAYERFKTERRDT